MKNFLFTAVAALLCASAAHAQTPVATPTAETAVTPATPAPTTAASRPTKGARIRQGVRSGELTPAEAARLRARRAELHQDRQDARADGTVTADERKDLRRENRRTSRAIYRQKHDGQTR